jgi:hypothetical protein
VLDGEMILPVVSKRLVERAVLLRSNIIRITRPNRLRLIEDVVLLDGLLDLFLRLLLLLVFVFNLLDLRLLGVVGSLLLILDLLRTT